MSDVKKRPSRLLTNIGMSADARITTSSGMHGLSKSTVGKLHANGFTTLGDLRKLTEDEINHLPWLTYPQKGEVVRIRKTIPNKFPDELQEDLSRATERNDDDDEKKSRRRKKQQ